MKTFDEALIEATKKAKQLFQENWKSIGGTETESYNESMIECYLHEDWGDRFHFEFFANTKDYYMKSVFYKFSVLK